MNKDIESSVEHLTTEKDHLIPMEPAGAAGFPASVSCSSCAALCAPPAGGDRASGATCELSAGSFHWAHKSFPAGTNTEQEM